jgi:NNP family nitrate/nitrite transporter-like MFS transporter
MVVSLGFTVSYVFWLGMLLILAILVYVYLKDAPYFQYREMGIEIDPDALLLACGEELTPSGTAMKSIKNAGADWRTWVLTYFYFVTFGGFIALTVWLPTYWAEGFGMSLVRAGLLTALYSIFASLVRVLGGLASDRMGGENIVLISFLTIGVGALSMTLASQSANVALAGEMILALGMGFANAAVFKLVPKYSPKAVGGAAGIIGGLGAFGGFVIPPVMGLYVKINGDAGYSQGFSVFLGLAILALILFSLLKRYAHPKMEKNHI